ncbi:MAG: hypothetical protein R3F53_29935 [Gammaproteobacteria bacterium]
MSDQSTTPSTTAYLTSPQFAARVITLVGLSMTAFHLFIAFYGPPNAFTLRSTHIGFALVLAFLILPARKANSIDRPNLLSWLLLAASIVVTAYPVIERDYIINRMIYVDDLRTIDFVFGWLMIAVLLEATRRSVGMALPLTAGLFYCMRCSGWIPIRPCCWNRCISPPKGYSAYQPAFRQRM